MDSPSPGCKSLLAPNISVVAGEYCSGQSSGYEACGSMTFLLSVTMCNVDISRAVRQCRVNSGATMSPEILNAWR